MADAPDLAQFLTARPAYRKGIWYLTTDADVVSVLSAMGFQQVANGGTAQDQQIALGLAQVVHAMSGVVTQKPLPIGVLRAPDGRLAVVFPSEPRAIIAEIGPGVKIPVLIMPTGRN